MPKIVHLTDNCSDGTLIERECISDIMRIANIRCLHDVPDLLVFPHSFSDMKDGIGDLSILTLHDLKFDENKCVSAKACTGNLMGFVGVNDTSVSIHSRFTHKKHDGHVDEQSQDFFLYYLLQKVLSINVFNLEHSNNRDDRILDFMLFLFPMMLKKALSQGLFKEYQTRFYDDAKVKGTIHINRFIRNDIPFKGTVSYSTHERCFDNSMTQLIRHTIEYIKGHPFGSHLLSMDAEMIEDVNTIIQATPSYCQRDRMRILNMNRQPKVHPYFTQYRNLQGLCVRILRHEALKYGKEKNKIHGVLFDGAWLWEEYLNTILKKCGFSHAENKLERGGIPMFEKADAEKGTIGYIQTLYPDFYKDDFIIDAKYKHLNNGVSKEDLYQVVTYMYCKKANNGGYLFPSEKETDKSRLQLRGYNGFIYLLPFLVPQFHPNYNLFIEKMVETEKVVTGWINNIKSRVCLST